jgi:hypothetical protein
MIDDGDAHQYVVNLTNVTNAQYIKVTLTNLNDSSGAHTESISQEFGVLIGDTTASASVNSADINQIKSQSGNIVTNSNFREDINTSGSISSSDVSLAKSKSGTSLPLPP